MEFNEKLQELRKQKGLTQEELAQALFVSRTAVSKWESNRGYPSIDSLKAIAKFFSVTIDELLSGDEVLTIAEEDSRQKEGYFCDMVFGLLDCSAALFFFLPLFGQNIGGVVYEVSLLTLNAVAPYLRAVYFATVSGIAAWGILTLALQNCSNQSWINLKRKASLALNVAGVLIFIISSQPYAAVLLFIFLLIKALIFVKKR
jgi:transcriptional regulator with XRE-family HTH domain